MPASCQVPAKGNIGPVQGYRGCHYGLDAVTVAEGLYYLQMAAQGLQRDLPRWRSSFGPVTLQLSTPRGGVGSVECAGREHEARRSPWLGLAAGV